MIHINKLLEKSNTKYQPFRIGDRVIAVDTSGVYNEDLPQTGIIVSKPDSYTGYNVQLDGKNPDDLYYFYLEELTLTGE